MKPSLTTTPTIRFTLDVHLGRLARNLRRMGLNAEWSDDAKDDALREAAIAESRVLLTRDRALFESMPENLRHYVAAIEPDAQTLEVLERFDLIEYARSKRGFLTRCLQCNTPIVPVKGVMIADRLPGHVLQEFSEFFLCQRCERVYWNGSHVDRMKEWVDRLLESARG